MPLEMSDAAPLDGVRRTRDGYLVANVRAGRTGIQEYAGAELGEPNRSVVRVYRPEDEVFDGTAMATAAHRPVTVGHPSQAVTAESWRDVAVGMTGGDVVRDGGYLKIPLVLMDQGAIDAVEAGSRELSWGYTCDLEWTAGQTPDGQPYDAVQRAIRINHLAVVSRGRAGPECRIGDAARGAGAAETTPIPTTSNGGRIMPDESNVRPVLLDGITIRTNDAGAEAISRLQRQLSDAATAADALRAEHAQRIQSLDGQIGALKATHSEALQARDGEVAALKATHAEALEAKDGEIVGLKAQIPDAAALDAMLASRMACADEAARVHGEGFDPRGKSEVEMRRIAVTKRLGDAVVTAMSDAEVGGAFRALAASSTQAPKPDPLRAAITAGAGTVAADAAKPSAFSQYVNRIENAWRHADAKGSV